MKSNLVIKFRLHTKSHPLIPIEKPFSKAHAPVIGLMLDRNF